MKMMDRIMSVFHRQESEELIRSREITAGLVERSELTQRLMHDPESLSATEVRRLVTKDKPGPLLNYIWGAGRNND